MWRRQVVVTLVLAVVISATTTAQSEGTVASVSPEPPLSRVEIDRFIQPLFSGYDAPAARFPVDVAVLQVVTRYPNGRPTTFRVQVFVPAADEEPDGVYLFSPGSTGLVGPCRASREHVAGIRWGLYRAHVLAMAAQGFVGILPDYMGFEDNALVQPYFHAASEARVVFDALHGVDRWIRATYPRRFARGLRPLPRVAAGFSQGGHAAFAAADRNESMGGELYLHGVIGYGPTTQIEPMLQRYPSLGPMVAMSFLSVYGRSSFNPHEVLQRRWADELEYDTTRQCVGGIQGYYPSDPYELYDDAFLASLQAGTLGETHPVIARIFRANETGLAEHRVPALILQGTDDIVVARKTQDLFVEELRRRGNPVDYRVYRGSRHDTRQIAFDAVTAWIRARDAALRPPQEGGPERFDPELDQ